MPLLIAPCEFEAHSESNTTLQGASGDCLAGCTPLLIVQTSRQMVHCANLQAIDAMCTPPGKWCIVRSARQVVHAALGVLGVHTDLGPYRGHLNAKSSAV